MSIPADERAQVARRLVDILNENGPQALMTVNGRYVDRLVLSSCGRGDVRVVSFDRS